VSQLGDLLPASYLVARPARWEEHGVSGEDHFSPKFVHHADESDPDVVGK
jgi:hypothetical protein